MEPLGEACTRLVFEVRHTLFAGLRRHFGAVNSREDERSLSGDELLPDAAGQMTHGITILREAILHLLSGVRTAHVSAR